MKLSVIIPVYNVEKHISRCLDSLTDQDLGIHDYEIIIISDGSKDNSEAIAKSYCETYSNVHLFVQQNAGVGCARNNGLKRAKGDYIYFLDPDDYILPNVFGQLFSTAIDNSLDILTFSSESFLESNSKPVMNNTISNTGTKEIKLSSVSTGIDYIAKKKYDNAIWWYFIKREFIDEIDLKFIEGRWMEDAIFTVKLFIQARRIAHINLDVHRYRIAPGTAMTSKETEHYLKVIRDNKNAAIVFKPIIEGLEKNKVNKDCIERIKARQQSFVFFLMARMLKSSITLEEIKLVLKEIESIGAYPIDSFIGKDYNKLSYTILVPIFNKKSLFYLLFRITRPFFG